MIFEYFKHEQRIRNQGEYPPKCPYLKQSQAIEPSFLTITKSLSNKILETCCELLKYMYKLLDIDGRKDF